MDTKKMHDIADEMKRERIYFPRFSCYAAADRVARETELIFLEGYHDGEEHAWNYNPLTDEYVDITFRQFDPSAPEIRVVKKDSPEGRRYVTIRDRRIAQGKPVHMQ
jgi:hypothetical protein